MKPIWKWIIGIIGALLLVFFGGIWYLGNHWKPLLNEHIHQLVSSSSDSLYQVTYDDLDFNLITGDAEVTNFKLIPDTQVYHQLKVQQRAPDNLYEISVARLLIQNFHPNRIYTERRLNIDEIRVENPDIKVINETQSYNDTVKVQDKRTLYQKISKVLKELAVAHLTFEEVNIAYTNRNEAQEKTTRLRNVSINVDELRVDSLSDIDTLRFYNARAVDVHMGGYRIATGDSLYYVDLNGIHFSSADRKIVLDSLKLSPRYSKVEFYKKINISKDRFDIAFDTITIGNIDLFKLIKQQRLFAGYVQIGQSHVDIFNNKAYPAGKKEPKIGQYPHQQLVKLAFPLKIDTLLLQKADISYAEYNGKSKQVGKISFNETKATFYNITNAPEALRQNNYLLADIHTKFMNQGRLNIHFEFDLTDPKGAFSYQGALASMDARYLNPVLKPLALVEINSGNLRRLSFSVRANEHLARGNVQFYYNKLAVDVITFEKDGTRSKNNMVSVLTNKFLINDSNPDANEKYHPGPIAYRRPPEASFFNFLWKSLFEGVKASVGVDKDRENKLLSTAKEADKAAGKVKGFFNRLFKKKEQDSIRR